MKLRTLLCVVLMVLVTLPLVAGKKTVKKEIPDYSTTARKDIPAEFTWKIEDLYPSYDAWKQAKGEFEQMAGKIDEMANGWTTSAKKMLAMLDFQTELMKKGYRLYSYASHQSNMELSNPKFQEMKGQMQSIYVKISAKLSFMNDDILKLGKKNFDQYLKKEPGLKVYEFGINDTYRTAKHKLPKDQQRIVSMTALFSGAAGKASTALNNLDLPAPVVTLPDGKKVPLNYANYAKYRADKDRGVRDMVMNAYWENHKKFENTFSILVDAGMKQHLFGAKVRNYKDCLSARLDGDNIDPAVYHSLIEHVRGHIDPFHRYLKVRQELLKLDKYKYADMYASAVNSVEKKYTYDEAKQIVMDCMKPMGQVYGAMLKKAFDNRWVDVYPNKGKQSGAYSGGVYGIHPFIKMNYNGTYDNVSTLAHELGHAMHSEFSNAAQHFENSGYPTFLAEIASTFNENMLIQHLLKTEKDDLLKLFILDGFLLQVKGTIYRQTQFAEFELAMHQRVEAGQTLTAEWLNKKYLELVKYYYGHDKGVVEVGDYIQNEWASIPHFFYNYYVYTYSTGMIASMALSDMVLNGGKAEQEKYLDFLKAGGSRHPLDTLKLAGVDMTTPAPYNAAFKRFSELVTEMENIVKRLKAKGKI